ncbi:Monooxygenase OS=Streptomyces aurantiogriseus OX=66870 GN=GCM10010251_49740 PE=4 SV=1 [Streptomyces aurantiogriseus]
MAQSRHAVVIGGGIGGLTAAAALHQSGWQVTVLERARSLEPVGAAISLAPNALRALDVIGLGDEIRDLAAWQGDGGLRTPGGRWLSRARAAAAAERFGGPLVLLHRATLIDSLGRPAPSGCRPHGRRRDPGRSRRRPAAGPGTDARRRAGGRPGRGRRRHPLRRTTDAVPGPPRRRLLRLHHLAGGDPGPRRGVRLARDLGEGPHLGHPPPEGRPGLRLRRRHDPRRERAPDDEKAELLRRFGDWHDPIPAVLAAARPEDVLRHDVHHLAEPLPAFHRGRVALLGDAAHAMPPTLGQGGNQAIEDAIVLAHHCDDLAAHTAARLPRTTAIARQAVRIARLNMTSNRALMAVRNTAIAALSQAGPALFLRGFDGIADWRPPQPAYAAVQAGADQQ